MYLAVGFNSFSFFHLRFFNVLFTVKQCIRTFLHASWRWRNAAVANPNPFKIIVWSGKFCFHVDVAQWCVSVCEWQHFKALWRKPFSLKICCDKTEGLPTSQDIEAGMFTLWLIEELRQWNNISLLFSIFKVVLFDIYWLLFVHHCHVFCLLTSSPEGLHGFHVSLPSITALFLYIASFKLCLSCLCLLFSLPIIGQTMLSSDANSERD